jgi:hypothetical protein
MRTKLFTTSLAIGFAAGLGAAIAAPQQPLNLTQQQQQTIQQQLSSKSAQAVPANFIAEVGAKVPQSLILHPLPQQIGSKVQAVKNDDFAKLKDNKILIVNPTDRRVAAVINENGATTGSSSHSMQKPSANMNMPNSPK